MGGGAQHLALQEDLPEARLAALHQLLRHRPEVEREKARALAVGPAVGDHLHDPERPDLVGAAAEVAEHVVEGDAAAEHLPRGDGGVEAARDERHGAALGAEREPARAGHGVVEEVRRAAVHLDAHRHLGRREVDAPRAGEEERAELALEVARAEGLRRPVTEHPRAHREAPARDGAAEAFGAGGGEARDALEADALDEGERLHAEDTRERGRAPAAPPGGRRRARGRARPPRRGPRRRARRAGCGSGA